MIWKYGDCETWLTPIIQSEKMIINGITKKTKQAIEMEATAFDNSALANKFLLKETSETEDVVL